MFEHVFIWAICTFLMTQQHPCHYYSHIFAFISFNLLSLLLRVHIQIFHHVIMDSSVVRMLCVSPRISIVTAITIVLMKVMRPIARRLHAPIINSFVPEAALMARQNVS